MRYVPISARLAVEVGVTPTYFSDFRATNSDAFRLLGRAVGFYARSERTQFVLGAVYLNIGEEIPLLPVAGMIWAPQDDLRYELVFPQPVIGRRIQASACRERWLFVSGEFAGGSWATQRDSGVKDVVNYSDWRVITGLETRFSDGHGWRAEVGYTFGRWLDYDSGIGDVDPDSTIMFRLEYWL
jgi:hypothetical protein